MALAVGALTLTLTGCGDSAGTGPASRTVRCGNDTLEPLNPQLSHALPGAPEPHYLTDPPTSGPHLPGATSARVRTEPLSRPAQVGVLEAGQVLLQYRDLDTAELARLTALSGPTAVVAPNPTLPDRVVATAWLHKLRCDGVDETALRAFGADHAGNGPGSDG